MISMKPEDMPALSEERQATRRGGRTDTLQRLIGMVKEGKIGGVAIWKIDRLSRDVRDLLNLVEMFNEHGVGFASVCENVATTTPSERMMLSMLGVFAQLEREQTQERVRLGIRQVKLNGGWIGGPVPAGCRVVEQAGKKMLEVNPATQPVISQIWSMVAKGAILNDIAKYLTEKGIAPPRKKGWRPATVHSLLSIRPATPPCRLTLLR